MECKTVLLKLILAMVLVSSCKKYLDQPAIGQLNAADLSDQKGVESLLIGAYSMLDGFGSVAFTPGAACSNWIFGSICGTEAHKGGGGPEDQQDILNLEEFVTTAYNSVVEQKWGAVFEGIHRANDVLRILAITKGISLEDSIRIAAEARFLRAHYHFEAKKMWNNVPFVSDSITYDAGNYKMSNEKDIWPDIQNDLIYAAKNLKIDPYQGAVGRATKYMPMALLAKAYLFSNDFSLAKPLLDSIISSGKYSLAQHYHDNFDPAMKNGPESVFAVQMSVNDGQWPGNAGDYWNFPMNIGYCFFQPSQYLVNHFKTDAVSGLPDPDLSMTGIYPMTGAVYRSVYSIFRHSGSRLDWTVAAGNSLSGFGLHLDTIG
jgi:hypothetical protein